MERALKYNRGALFGGAACTKEPNGAAKPKDVSDPLKIRQIIITRSAAEIATMYIEPVVLTPADREKPEYLKNAKTHWE